MTYTSPFPIIDVTVDAVVLARGSDGLVWSVLTITRGNDPYKGCAALPGGFLDVSEDAVASAVREVREETALDLDALPCTHRHLTPRTNPARDPRKRIISLPLMFVLNDPTEDLVVAGGDDAASAGFISVGQALEGPLAFDHTLILREAARVLAESGG